MPQSSTTSVPSTVTLFDDERRADGLNGQPAAAQPIKECVDALNAIAGRARPIFNSWGGGPQSAGANGGVASTWWMEMSPAAPGIRGAALVVPSIAQPLSGQGVTFSHGTPSLTSVGKTDAAVAAYPGSCQTMPLGYWHRTNKALLTSAEVSVGNATANGPRIESGIFYEPAAPRPPEQLLVDTGSDNRIFRRTHVPTDWIAQGSPILGTAGTVTSGNLTYSDGRAFASLALFFRDVFKGRRLAFGWSCSLPGTNYLGISGSANGDNYRYIFDQRIGQGATAPSAAGPGICIPLKYTASGRRTSVRIYCAMRAYVTGGTGSVAVYTQNADGTFAGPTGPVLSVTSTVSSWHIPGSLVGSDYIFNPAAQYFTVDTQRSFNKILLCAKVSAGQTLKITGLSLAAYHSAA